MSVVYSNLFNLMDQFHGDFSFSGLDVKSKSERVSSLINHLLRNRITFQGKSIVPQLSTRIATKSSCQALLK